MEIEEKPPPTTAPVEESDSLEWTETNQPKPRWLTDWQAELKSSLKVFKLEAPAVPDEVRS